MRSTLIYSVVLSGCLIFVQVVRASSSPESLWHSGAQFQNLLQRGGFSDVVEESEKEKLLKLIKRRIDRTYRLENDLKMLSRTATEIQTELDSFPADEKEQVAHRDRIEHLLKFIVDVVPVEIDNIGILVGSVVSFGFDIAPPVEEEISSAVRDLDAGIERAAAVSEEIATQAAALQKKAVELDEALGERALWLAERFKEDSSELQEYSQRLKKLSKQLLEKIDPEV